MSTSTGGCSRKSAEIGQKLPEMDKIALKAAEPSSIGHIMALKEDILITELVGRAIFLFWKRSLARNGRKLIQK